MSGTQNNDFLPIQRNWREILTLILDNPYNKGRSIKKGSAGRALSVFLPGLGFLRSLLFFKFSALAAPLRRSCSALVLAALSVAVAGAQPADNWIIETVAGNGTEGFGGDGGAAVAAQLYLPLGVALDGAGNLYIADLGNHRIRKVDAAGVITTVAGSGSTGEFGGGFGGDGGAATGARLSSPAGMALDGAGNLYIADGWNHRIRKVDAAGTITTVAGSGRSGLGSMGGYSGDGGPATAAQLYAPAGVALDGAGNLYIADLLNHRIRKVDSAGVITTVAGSGEVGFGEGGFGGDGGPATAAQLNFPEGVALDGAGNLYISDTRNQRIRKVDAAGVITTVAGYGPTGEGEGGFGGDGGATVRTRRRGAGRRRQPVHRR